MKFKHVIFDLDGTLMDTETAVIRTWLFTLKEYGYEYSFEDMKRVQGLPMVKILEKLGVDVDSGFEKRWVENYGQFGKEAEFFPGVPEMLETLKSRGCKLGIITSRTKDEYNGYFRGYRLEECFEIILCADDTEQHKPNPEPVYEYARLAGAKLEDCIYMGDMPTDMECANRAGIASGFVTWKDAEGAKASRAFGAAESQAKFIFHNVGEVLEKVL